MYNNYSLLVSFILDFKARLLFQNLFKKYYFYNFFFNNFIKCLLVPIKNVRLFVIAHNFSIKYNKKIKNIFLYLNLEYSLRNKINYILYFIFNIIFKLFIKYNL